MNNYTDFYEQARLTPQYQTKNFEVSLCPKGNDLNWTAMVRLLESEGFVVAATTAKFPTGVYCAEGLTENGKLKGWKLETEIPEKIVVTNLGWPFCSRKPEAPKINDGGLKFVPHHVMAVFVGHDNGWEQVLYLPSGQITTFVADTSGIQYGQSGFEGCMTMRDKVGSVYTYRLDQNAKRFSKTVDSLDLPSFSATDHETAIRQVVAYNQDYVPSNEDGKLYIRPSVLGLNGGLGLIVPEHYLVTVEIAAFGNYLPESITVEALKSIHRPPSGSNKIAPNYGASFKIKHGVKARGYNDYLSFDHEGNVEEVSTCAVAFIDEVGNFVFPPVQDEIDQKERHILPSITRKSTIEVLKSLGKTVVVRDVPFTEIPKMKGVFTMGNAVGVLHVSKICLRRDVEDEGTVLDFNTPEIREKIFSIRDKIFQARVGQLPGFENWAVKV